MHRHLECWREWHYQTKEREQNYTQKLKFKQDEKECSGQNRPNHVQNH
jgi:hypothetical protein